jgi:hypothetical protein
MELLPDDIRQQIPTLYAQEGMPDPVAYVKFFTPGYSFVWFATEFSREDGDTFFGYLITEGEGELGYFSLRYLSSRNTPLMMLQEMDMEMGKRGKTLLQAGRLPTVVRDESFTPCPLSQAKKEYEESTGTPHKEKDIIDIVREMIAKQGRTYSAEQETFLLADFCLDMTREEEPAPLQKIRKLRSIRETAADYLLEWVEEVFQKHPEELEALAPSTGVDAQSWRVVMAKGKKHEKMRPMLIKLAMLYQPSPEVLAEEEEAKHDDE